LQMFQRTIVSDGSLGQRNRFIQVVVESYLLANIPVVIFDQDENFEGLAHPTKKRAELQTHGVMIEPIGFPTKSFEPLTDIKANLNALAAGSLLEFFGCNDKEAEKMLDNALKKGKAESLPELIERIDGLGSEEAANLFLKQRLERILALIEAIYPGLFAGNSNIGEIVKTWFKKIGRASIVHVGKTDPRALTILLDSLLNEFAEFFKQQNETGKPGLLVAIPEVDRLFSIRSSLVLEDFVKRLTEMKRHGVGFVVGAEKRAGLKKPILQIAETKASIIKENDAAIDFPNSKNYRLIVRPTLSQLKEEESGH